MAASPYNQTVPDRTNDADSVSAPSKSASDPSNEAPLVVPRPDHVVSRSFIDANAQKVLYRLHKAGYRGYLVGGSVRDLMVGLRPKDFDVATDARPNDLRRLFRNARIIGRRFRLAHVMFKEGIVEVSTFRGPPNPDEQASAPDELLITNDNTYGTPREDAFRRDFTINALFYDIGDFSVIDYVGGIEDLRKRSVRVIGDPDVRFQEDPVRMMRACEFAGRLGFTIEARTQEAIQANRHELEKAAPARLTEEVLQLLRCGSAGAALQWMLELGLLEVLLPEVLAMVRAQQVGAGDFGGVIATLDAMIGDERAISDSVLLSALLLPEIMLRRFDYEQRKRRWMPIDRFQDEVSDVLDTFLQRFQIANHKRAAIRQTLDGFHRLCDQRWTPAKRVRFASKRHFDDSLLVFEILTRATGHGQAVLEQWQAVARQRARRPEPPVERRRRRRRRPRRHR